MTSFWNINLGYLVVVLFVRQLAGAQDAKNVTFPFRLYFDDGTNTTVQPTTTTIQPTTTTTQTTEIKTTTAQPTESKTTFQTTEITTAKPTETTTAQTAEITTAQPTTTPTAEITTTTKPTETTTAQTAEVTTTQPTAITTTRTSEITTAQPTTTSSQTAEVITSHPTTTAQTVEITTTAQPTETTTAQTAEITTAQPTTTPTAEIKTTTNPTAITTAQTADITTTQPTETTKAQTAEITTTQPTETKTAQTAEVITSQPTATAQTAEITTTAKPTETTTAQTAEITTTQPTETTTAQTADITTTQPTETTTAQTAEITTTAQSTETTTAQNAGQIATSSMSGSASLKRRKRGASTISTCAKEDILQNWLGTEYKTVYGFLAVNITSCNSFQADYEVIVNFTMRALANTLDTLPDDLLSVLNSLSSDPNNTFTVDPIKTKSDPNNSIDAIKTLILEQGCGEQFISSSFPCDDFDPSDCKGLSVNVQTTSTCKIDYRCKPILMCNCEEKWGVLGVFIGKNGKCQSISAWVLIAGLVLAAICIIFIGIVGCIMVKRRAKHTEDQSTSDYNTHQTADRFALTPVTKAPYSRLSSKTSKKDSLDNSMNGHGIFLNLDYDKESTDIDGDPNLTSFSNLPAYKNFEASLTHVDPNIDCHIQRPTVHVRMTDQHWKEISHSYLS